MAHEQEARTGLFQQKSTNEYVVLWKGREIIRYASIDDLIQAHALGLAALESSQAELLESYYRDL